MIISHLFNPTFDPPPPSLGYPIDHRLSSPSYPLRYILSTSRTVPCDLLSTFVATKAMAKYNNGSTAATIIVVSTRQDQRGDRQVPDDWRERRRGFKMPLIAV